MPAQRLGVYSDLSMVKRLCYVPSRLRKRNGAGLGRAEGSHPGGHTKRPVEQTKGNGRATVVLLNSSKNIQRYYCG